MSDLNALSAEVRAMRAELATVLAEVRAISNTQAEHDRMLRALATKLDETYTLVMIGPPPPLRPAPRT